MKNIYTKLFVLFLGIICLSCSKKESTDINTDPTKKTVTCYAGGLSTLLSDVEKSTVTNLTLKGSIDARDFLTMRNMSVLSTLDMSAVSIVAYSGKGGTYDGSVSYPANEIPLQAFYFGDYSLGGKVSLKSIILPNSLTSIGRIAFASCTGLTSVTIPQNVTSIGQAAFNGCTNIKSIYLNMNTMWSIDDSQYCFSASIYSTCVLYAGNWFNHIKGYSPWNHFVNIKQS